MLIFIFTLTRSLARQVQFISKVKHLFSQLLDILIPMAQLPLAVSVVDLRDSPVLLLLTFVSPVILPVVLQEHFLLFLVLPPQQLRKNTIIIIGPTLLGCLLNKIIDSKLTQLKPIIKRNHLKKT